jgi:hypothetical protein
MLYRPFVLLALVLASGALGTRGAAVDSTPGDEIIELPKFIVTDSRVLPLPEAWRYAEIPGFEILSNASARETARFVRDFQMLQEVVSGIWPAARLATPVVPTSLVLCARGNSFDVFLPSNAVRESLQMNSLFLQDDERVAIVIDFALNDLQLGDGTTEASDPYRAFYLQYFRFLIRRMSVQPPPPWLEEGLVQLFASVDFNKKMIDFAKIGDGFGGANSGDFNQRLAQRGLVPMATLFAAVRPSQDEAPFWDSQAYEFVHLCLYGVGKRYQKPFLQFVSRAGQEPVTEAMFKECFGMSYKEMELELRSYADFTAYQYIQFRAKKGTKGLDEPPAIQLRDATDAEVGRIKGEALRLAGNADAAHNALIAPYIRGSRDPQLLAALGLSELASGQTDRARKFLEAAAKAKAVRARAYLELARLRYAAAEAQSADGKGPLNAEQTAQVLQPLFTARTQPPPMREMYEFVLDVWAHSTRVPTRADYDLLLDGARAFPRQLPLIYRTAEFGIQYGFTGDAAKLVEHGLKYAPTPEGKELFAQLKTRLPAPSAPALPGPAPSAPAPTPAVPTAPR